MARRRKPSFFKVLVDDFSNNLEIPPAFYMHFAGNVPRQSRLRTPAGTWNVNVEKVDDGFFFQKGWKEFVHDNGLKVCEFLIFRYAGNSKFSVDIYGRNGCKKVFAMADRKSSRPLEKENGNAIQGKHYVDGQRLRSADGTSTGQAICTIKDEEIDTESETWIDIDESETLEDQLSEDSEIGSPRELGSAEHLFSRALVENPSEAGLARALEAANQYSSKHPFFKVVMKPAYVNKVLLVPKTFVNSYIGKRTFVRLQDSKRRWHVKCLHNRYSTNLSAGWISFVRHHALKPGDVCVFELIETDDVVLKVSIFRCSSGVVFQ